MNLSLAIYTKEVGRVYKLRGRRRKDEPKQRVALDGVTLEVEHGELFGLLCLIPAYLYFTNFIQLELPFARLHKT